jgi:hypothetical protein
MNGIQLATVILLGFTFCVQIYTVVQIVKTARIRKRTALLYRLHRANLRIDAHGKVVRAGGRRA